MEKNLISYDHKKSNELTEFFIAYALATGSIIAIDTLVNIGFDRYKMKKLTVPRYISDNFDSNALIKNVEGPVTIRYFNIPSINKKFYLFGDFHTKLSTCDRSYENTVPVPRLFDLMIKYNPNLKFDLLIENDYSIGFLKTLSKYMQHTNLAKYDSLSGTHGSRLFDTITMFKSCDVS
jgi:hypothetical protein